MSGCYFCVISNSQKPNAHYNSISLYRLSLWACTDLYIVFVGQRVAKLTEGGGGWQVETLHTPFLSKYIVWLPQLLRTYIHTYVEEVRMYLILLKHAHKSTYSPLSDTHTRALSIYKLFFVVIFVIVGTIHALMFFFCWWLLLLALIFKKRF